MVQWCNGRAMMAVGGDDGDGGGAAVGDGVGAMVAVQMGDGGG